MKKIQNLIIAIATVCAMVACQRNKHRFVTSDGTNRLEAEYSGKIVFDDEQSIGHMSRLSYFKVNNNGTEIEVKCDNMGRITYIDDNGDKKSKPSADDKKLLAEGVKLILTSQKGAGKR